MSCLEQDPKVLEQEDQTDQLYAGSSWQWKPLVWLTHLQIGHEVELAKAETEGRPPQKGTQKLTKN